MEQAAHLAPESLTSDILENMSVADLQSVMAQLVANPPVGRDSHPLDLNSLQTAYVQTLLNAKQGFNLEVGQRMAAQYSMATNKPAGLALAKYQALGWDAAMQALLAEDDFIPQVGPLCLWSELEGGWWVHDFGWADSPWAAAGYPPRSWATPALPFQGVTPPVTGQVWVRWDSLPR